MIFCAADVIADTFLVVVPLHMLWNVKLPRRQRRVVLSIFAASILNSLAGIVYAVLVFNAKLLREYRGVLIGLAAHIMVSLVFSARIYVSSYTKFFLSRQFRCSSATSWLLPCISTAFFGKNRMRKYQSPPKRALNQRSPHLPPRLYLSLMFRKWVIQRPISGLGEIVYLLDFLLKALRNDKSTPSCRDDNGWIMVKS
jgi:hypothetical protein